MPNQDDIWTLKKYLLYDFAHDRLANRRLFACYDTAAQAAHGQATVMIVPLALKRAQAGEESEPHDCSRLTRF